MFAKTIYDSILSDAIDQNSINPNQIDWSLSDQVLSGPARAALKKIAWTNKKDSPVRESMSAKRAAKMDKYNCDIQGYSERSYKTGLKECVDKGFAIVIKRNCFGNVYQLIKPPENLRVYTKFDYDYLSNKIKENEKKFTHNEKVQKLHQRLGKNCTQIPIDDLDYLSVNDAKSRDNNAPFEGAHDTPSRNKKIWHECMDFPEEIVEILNKVSHSEIGYDFNNTMNGWIGKMGESTVKQQLIKCYSLQKEKLCRTGHKKLYLNAKTFGKYLFNWLEGYRPELSIKQKKEAVKRKSTASHNETKQKEYKSPNTKKEFRNANEKGNSVPLDMSDKKYGFADLNSILKKDNPKFYDDLKKSNLKIQFNNNPSVRAKLNKIYMQLIAKKKSGSSLEEEFEKEKNKYYEQWISENENL